MPDLGIDELYSGDLYRFYAFLAKHTILRCGLFTGADEGCTQ